MEIWQRRTKAVATSSMAISAALLFLTFLIMILSLLDIGGLLSVMQFGSSIGSLGLLTHSTLDQLQNSPSTIMNEARGEDIAEMKGEEIQEYKKKKKGVEEELARARATIRKAAARDQRKGALIFNDSAPFFLFRNPALFYRSYLEMERRFKIYVYEEGDQPMVHDGPCKEMYLTEGRFIHQLENYPNRFKTRDPNQAHVFFVPFSVSKLVQYIWDPAAFHDRTGIARFVSDYIGSISSKYPFWNRTQGADHFMLSCHDWGPFASMSDPYLYKNSIRALCNANSSEGFNPLKDVSLPEIHLKGGQLHPKLHPSPQLRPYGARPYLAFFAGGVHGPIRPIILDHWKGRDPELQVHEYLPKHLDYYSLMAKAKFCICPSGYEVASPRISESIYAECVPVIISKNYVLPLSDVIRWDAFSIQVEVEDIPRLKEILKAVTEDEYNRLVEGLRAFRKHFSVNTPAQRFDAFHMTLHSVWLRRLNFKLR